ncbi:MAG: exo-beta-N-acetylmuramidase NamZ domain-containing protein [Candidatus Binatia bacterium]
MNVFRKLPLLIVVIQLIVVPLALAQATAGVQSDRRAAALEPIAGIVEKEIQAGRIPGAAIFIGHQGRIVYRRAFGYHTLQPSRCLMTEDSIFDLASLTKVVATSTAVMQLAEEGKLRLDEPVARYWPAFKANGKGRITLRQLLTHYSGLRPDLDLARSWSGYDSALKRIVAERPVAPAGVAFRYSDINFETLGELVRRIAGQPLDLYCAEHIFQPLGMNDTGFRLSPAQRERIAPTGRGRPLLGQVYDPTAYRMGGVAGHAGLFSTAADLAIFAQMMLDGGSAHGTRILSPLTVDRMTTPQTPSGAPARGLGWDIDSPFASHWHPFLGERSYGHTGYTGTSLWIDPVTRTYVIILTNRVYPDGKGDAQPLRTHIAEIVAEAFGLPPAPLVQARSEHESRARFTLEGGADSSDSARVETGVDVLAAEGFAPLSGLRVGVITNHSGLDSAGRRTIDLMQAARGVKLTAIFAPEHGLNGDLDAAVTSSREPTTGLPIFSLYGEVRRPTATMLDGMDALVFDVQDAGVRFYTYLTTMAYAMEASARKGIPFYVLDRPNPLSASVVQGPILDADLESFTGYFPLPVRYGMTVGELAELFNSENKIGAQLHVIKMRGYRRDEWYDETGLQWLSPSPNLRSLQEAALYAGVALIEGANVSVGRGTATPFELVGAPWIDGKALASYLSRRQIPGVRFKAVDFTPAEDRFKNRRCHGVQIVLLDRRLLDGPHLGVELASALHQLSPQTFQLDHTLGMIGARWVLRAVKHDENPLSIVRRWQAPLEQFRLIRAKYLLY